MSPLSVGASSMSLSEDDVNVLLGTAGCPCRSAASSKVVIVNSPSLLLSLTSV